MNSKSTLREDLENTINNLASLIFILCRKGVISLEELNDAYNEMIKAKIDIINEIKAEDLFNTGDGLKV